MIGEEIKALVRYRLEQAEQALRDARILLDSGSSSAAVNRSYYAMFYAVLALLAVRGLGTSRHSGAIALFDREFVLKGAFDKELSQWLHQTFNLRLRADYREMVMVSRERAETAMQNAQQFVSRVKAHLDTQILS
jgi:uncharacterized protein (UPF0332 family)